MAVKKPEDEKGLYSATPYDDAFRTMEGECDDLLLPLVNYFFDETYDEGAKITRLRNEHFDEKTDGSEKRKITDSHFSIMQGGVTKYYHMECESSGFDESYLIKMFEYTSLIAKDEAEHDKAALHVRFPYTGLLLLAGGRDVPESAEVIITTPKGEMSYDIVIINRKDIGLDEIFEKRLYFLIPFYIFNYKDNLNHIDDDPDQQEELTEKYKEIYNRMDVALKERKLSLFSFGVIIESMRRVSYNMTLGHEKVHKKVGDMMGGQIMDLEWIRAWRAAEAEGREECRKEDIDIFITDKREDGVPEEKIREKLKKYYGLEDAEIDVYLNGEKKVETI